MLTKKKRKEKRKKMLTKKKEKKKKENANQNGLCSMVLASADLEKLWPMYDCGLNTLRQCGIQLFS